MQRPTPTAPRRMRDERGQTIAIAAGVMLVMLGMCALVIDLGQAWQTRRALQSAVDAAALAGAADIPQGWTVARASASGNYAHNGRGGDAVTYAQTTTAVPNDTIVVTASRDVSSVFSTLFGASTRTVSATARATIQSYTSIRSHQNVMPWGVMKTKFVPGSTYSIYVDSGGSPDNGSLSLPLQPDCAAASGASDYADTITGTQNACDVSLNEIVPTKGGQNAGPTKQSVGNRIPDFQPVQKIVSIAADGSAVILQPSSPQLVLLPLVMNSDGSNVWPATGSGNVRVVGFAWFVITSIGGGNGSNAGKNVNGVFVTASVPDTGSSGAYDPKSAVNTVALTS
jgi:Flp pilus assembly protein TadG